MRGHETQSIILHGSWIPGESGRCFAVWAEMTRQNRSPQNAKRHSCRAPKTVLYEFMKATWPELATDFVEKTVWAVLPGRNGQTVPSPEFQAAQSIESKAPTEWLVRELSAITIRDPMAFLGDLGKMRSVGPARSGSDLRFWAHMTERLNGMMARHEYIPGFFADTENFAKADFRAGARRRQTKKKAKSTEKLQGGLVAGWEYLQGILEFDIQQLADCAPGICRSLWLDKPECANGGIPLHDAKGLIGNFASTTLNRYMKERKYPLKVRKMVDHDPFALAIQTPGGNEFFRGGSAYEISGNQKNQWVLWRKRVNQTFSDSDNRICFRLRDPDYANPDSWKLEWLLSSHGEPSRLFPLKDFWNSKKSKEDIRDVLLQLGQAARLYGRLWDGMNSAAPDSVALDREEALRFLREEAPLLQGAGYRVIVPSWWTASGQRRIRVKMHARLAPNAKGIQAAASGLLGLDSIVEYSPTLIFNGVELTMEEWNAAVQSKQELVSIRGHWMELKAEEIERLEEFWNSHDSIHEMTVADMIRAEAEPDVEFEVEGDLKGMLEALRDSGGVTIHDQPEGFAGNLRGYQLRGFSWLSCLESYGFGTVLADDMGLGKTAQTLAAMLKDLRDRPDGGQTLLVAPTSVLGNWRREVEKFAPEIATFIHHGTQREKGEKRFSELIADVDLVIVSFGIARMDGKLLRSVNWRRLVIDEAQNIKNPTAAITKALKAIPARRRIALTGTPVENRLMDLWSLYNVINPGMLGDSVAEFRREFEKPIMKDGDRKTLERLRGIVRPFILRRLKSDKSIIGDLPEKIEQNVMCSLTMEQASLYEAVVRDVESKLQNGDAKARSGVMLGALTRLKQICNHPSQFLQDGSDFSEKRSRKLERACGMVDEIIEKEESVLIFSQFTEIGKNLENLFRMRGNGRIFYMHGGTPRALREDMVDKFQDPGSEASVFILSLRAAGVGLNLTNANHVIHFDRWWNPAVENQATDRAYRIGQKKVVMVHKFVTADTLEERIDEMIESKRKLAEDVVGADESWLSNMESEAFIELIRLNRKSVLE
ncbi:MAG: DEAD/DEAH box helicase [Roseovarius sp.]|nr:DEAD/DEAH box helicase [Roseovarius sp.]